MRADAHYVDQLEMRRVSPDDTRPVASASHTAPPPHSRHEQSLLSESDLARSLSSVLSCTNLLNDGLPRLTRNVAIDMIRAETQRAICALQTAGVLKHGVSEERRVVSPRTLIERIAETIEPDARLRGTRVATAVATADDQKLRINDDAVVSGISAVVLMMSAGLDNVHGAQLDLTVSTTDAGRVNIAVRQESVILPEACLQAANARGEQSISPAVAPLVALRQIAESHGGDLAITRLPHGTQVAIEFASEVR
jgi:signal transduction histidine kinase